MKTYNQTEMNQHFPLLIIATVCLASLVSAQTISDPISVDARLAVDRPMLVDPSSPPKPASSYAIGVHKKSGGGSALTCTEVIRVMGPGRSFNFKTRTWETRPALSGKTRATFLDSYILHRSRVGASACNWGAESVSK